MPTKAEMYSQMADKVATQLVGSWKEWTAFLTTAARLYKYPFHEQMMIYAQRPDATACAEYDLWNEKMGRYVRRGSKGIALVDDSGDKPRLRYVFDISDTGTREHSRTPWLWQLEEQHIGPVSAMLERSYGVAGDDLAQQLTDGPDGQVVGLAADGVGIEDGRGDLLAVGHGDGRPGGDLRLAVQGYIGEVEGHLSRGGQGGGSQGSQGQGRCSTGQETGTSFFHRHHPFIFFSVIRGTGFLAQLKK